jgi:sugar phosphate permease
MRDKNTDRRRQAIRAWFVVACGALFYMYQFMVRVSPNIMNEELMTALSIDAATLGSIIGIYYWSYAIMQLPLGITMDRLGPRVFLCTAAFMCAGASYLFGNTSSVLVAKIARFLIGMGSACGLIGTIKLGTVWLEPKHIAKVTSLTIIFGTVGAAIGGTPLKLILINFGVEHTMEFLSAFGVVVGIVIYFVVHNHPPHIHKDDLTTVYANAHPFTDIQRIIRSPQGWVIAIFGMLMYVPIATIGDAWGVSFIERACKTTEVISPTVISTMFIGASLGSPFFAYLSDAVQSRRDPMLWGAFITTILWSVIIFVPGIPLSAMYILFFLAGFTYASKCITFVSICEVMPRNMSGISIAFVNMVVMTSGVIFNNLIGYMINSHWGGAILHNIPHYSEGDYRFGLISIPFVLLLSTLMMWRMKESKPITHLSKEVERAIERDVL